MLLVQFPNKVCRAQVELDNRLSVTELKPVVGTPEATYNMPPGMPLNLSALFCGLCVITPAYGQMAPAASPAGPTVQELDQAVTQGVEYMASQAEMNLQAVRTLQMAIASENLTGASML